MADSRRLSHEARSAHILRKFKDRGPPKPAKVERILASLRDSNKSALKGDTPVQSNHSPRLFSVSDGRYGPAGRIIIPQLELDTAFFNGVHEEVLRRGAGHWPGTPWPGQPGNSVFSGHRTTYSRPFGDLDRLQLGDIVRTRLGTQPPVQYKVHKTTVVPEERYAKFVLRQPKNDHARIITMFACHPKGYRTHRIVVQARADPPRGESPP